MKVPTLELGYQPVAGGSPSGAQVPTLELEMFQRWNFIVFSSNAGTLNVPTVELREVLEQ